MFSQGRRGTCFEAFSPRPRRHDDVEREPGPGASLRGRPGPCSGCAATAALSRAGSRAGARAGASLSRMPPASEGLSREKPQPRLPSLPRAVRTEGQGCCSACLSFTLTGRAVHLLPSEGSPHLRGLGRPSSLLPVEAKWIRSFTCQQPLQPRPRSSGSYLNIQRKAKEKTQRKSKAEGLRRPPWWL